MRSRVSWERSGRGHGSHRELAAGVLSAAVLVLLACGSAQAQIAKLRLDTGPSYVGVPVDIQIYAEGFEEEPQPEVAVELPKSGRLEFRGVSPSVSGSIQIVNGRITKSHRVQFTYSYRFHPDKAGRHRVGPFRFTQGEKSAATKAVNLNVTEIPVTDKQQIRLVVPEEPVYIGQRLPVRVEWWVSPDLRGKLYNANVRVPLFERLGEFNFIDPPLANETATMSILTASGMQKFAATAENRRREGKSYIVQSVSRTVVPMQAGRFELEPASVTVDQAIRFRRDLFGSRIPTQVLKLRAADERRVLIVKPLPAQGRPPSYAGAIGRGFTLDVAADRTVVQVGDPIKLTLTLRGDGPLESASLPPLGAGGGLPSKLFRVPARKVAGIFDDGAKRFEVSIRVLDQTVSEIPPIAYSWFDPDMGNYQTTHSRPVALAVREAKVVSARDVVRSAEGVEALSDAGDEEAAKEALAAGQRAAGDSTRPVFSFTGADLAIEKDVGRLAAAGRSRLTSAPAQMTLYGSGLLIIGACLLARRRAARDPVVVKRRKTLVAEHKRIKGGASVAEVADALRRTRAEVPGMLSNELDSLLADCDALVFAPGGATARPTDELRARALALAESIAKEVV